MLCTQAVIPAMKEANYGRVVSVASTAPFNPPPADMSPVSLYNAAKGGLIAWTKSAAAELAPIRHCGERCRPRGDLHGRHGQ